MDGKRVLGIYEALVKGDMETGGVVFGDRERGDLWSVSIVFLGHEVWGPTIGEMHSESGLNSIGSGKTSFLDLQLLCDGRSVRVFEGDHDNERLVFGTLWASLEHINRGEVRIGGPHWA